ncbi:MAG: hypothetical protein ACFE0I_04290 [Elainellaceae cyanobacterium]
MSQVMMMSSPFSAGILSIISALLLLGGCSVVQPSVEPSDTLQKSTDTEFDPFRAAVNTAMDAAEQTQTADSPDEWRSVALTWQEAINLMKAVPESSPKYDIAQQRAFEEYPENLQYAQEKAGDRAIADLAVDDDKLTQVDFGEGWPFTVDGEIDCERVDAGSYEIDLVFLRSIGQMYAINSPAEARAEERGWRQVDEIWRNDEDSGGKAPLTWVIMRGEALCAEDSGLDAESEGDRPPN